MSAATNFSNVTRTVDSIAALAAVHTALPDETRLKAEDFIFFSAGAPDRAVWDIEKPNAYRTIRACLEGGMAEFDDALVSKILSRDDSLDFSAAMVSSHKVETGRASVGLSDASMRGIVSKALLVAEKAAAEPSSERNPDFLSGKLLRILTAASKSGAVRGDALFSLCDASVRILAAEGGGYDPEAGENGNLALKYVLRDESMSKDVRVRLARRAIERGVCPLAPLFTVDFDSISAERKCAVENETEKNLTSEELLGTVDDVVSILRSGRCDADLVEKLVGASLSKFDSDGYGKENFPLRLLSTIPLGVSGVRTLGNHILRKRGPETISAATPDPLSKTVCEMLFMSEASRGFTPAVLFQNLSDLSSCFDVNLPDDDTLEKLVKTDAAERGASLRGPGSGRRLESGREKTRTRFRVVSFLGGRDMDIAVAPKKCAEAVSFLAECGWTGRPERLAQLLFMLEGERMKTSASGCVRILSGLTRAVEENPNLSERAAGLLRDVLSDMPPASGGPRLEEALSSFLDACARAGATLDSDTCDVSDVPVI